MSNTETAVAGSAASPCWADDLMASDGERHTIANIAYRLSTDEKLSVLRFDEVSWANYQTEKEYECRRRIQLLAQFVRYEINRFNQEHREHFTCKIF